MEKRKVTVKGNIMMFYKNLYVGDTIKNPNRIKRRLKANKKLINVFVIAYAQETKKLEIYNSLFMQQWYYKENPPFVVGIAGSKEEAMDIIVKITQEALHQTGKADLVSYLKEKE